MSEKPANAARRGAGRVAFLASKDLFRSLFEQGHSQRAIYDDHGSRLGITYSQFNRYMTRYLTEKESVIEQQNEVSSSSAPPSPGGRAKPDRDEDGATRDGEAKPEGKRPGQVGRKFEHKSVPDDKLI